MVSFFPHLMWYFKAENACSICGTINLLYYGKAAQMLPLSYILGSRHQQSFYCFSDGSTWKYLDKVYHVWLSQVHDKLAYATYL